MCCTENKREICSMSLRGATVNWSADQFGPSPNSD